MADISSQTKAAVGAPSSVRIGTVESINPVVISAQGVTFTNVGVLSTMLLVPGNPVVLLGQSPTSGSDPTSWLALGSTSPAGLRVLTAQATANFPLPVGLADIPGATVTFDTTLPQTFVQMWIFADIDTVLAPAAISVVRPVLDNFFLSAQTQIVYESTGVVTGRGTFAQRATFTLSPGTHTVKLEAGMAVGVAGSHQTVNETTNFMLNVYG